MIQAPGFRWLTVASAALGLVLAGAALPAAAGGASATVAQTPAVAPGMSHAAAPAADVGVLTDSSYQVTVAARTCTGYQVIMANRARNNIQESLRDLGPDTLYQDGQPVSPSVEDGQAVTQVSGCQPLVGWKFQLGRGIAGKVDDLSTVSSPFPGTYTTQASVPELTGTGENTGKQVAGAVTFNLTAEQAQLAQRGSSLWIQGGTTSDPLLDNTVPPFDPAQAFGALRCSIDNLNGDNVEWIGYPQSSTHVFCYYFTVSPAPDAATIVVKKTLLGATQSRTFNFRGNVSYNPGPNDNPDLNPFTVDSGSSISFVRAAGVSNWNFFEEPDDSYPLQDVKCSTANGTSEIVNPGAGTSQATPVRILFLSPGSTVTCEFINADEPPPANARLAVDKVTSGGVGTFRITADHPAVPAKTGVVTTTRPASPERAVELEAPGGTFTVKETLPAGVDDAAWRMRKLSCDNGYVNTKTEARQGLPGARPGGRAGHLRGPQHPSRPDQRPQDHQGRLRDVLLRDRPR